MDKQSIDKLKEISEQLLISKENNLGLYTGLSGMNIFHAHYSKNNDTIIQNIEKCINIISSGNVLHTFCSGVSGFLWSLKHLISIDVLSKNDVELFNQLNPFLNKKMVEDLNNDNWDFLHGALGVANYFLEDLNINTIKYIEYLIKDIERKSIKDKNGYKLSSFVFDNEKNYRKVFNLSLSHGMASIISFLSKAYSLGIYKNKWLLNGIIEFYINNMNDLQKYNSYFSNTISEDDELCTSRLAWCYGDLGIGISLYEAAVNLGNKALEELSISLFMHSAKRNNLADNSVKDAGICHGTAGISLIFNRMYKNTQIIEFKEAADYWLIETLKMARFNDGLAGFKAFHGEDGWINEYSLLEGISGIGLVLLSSLSKEDLFWDECLLIR